MDKESADQNPDVRRPMPSYDEALRLLKAELDQDDSEPEALFLAAIQNLIVGFDRIARRGTDEADGEETSDTGVADDEAREAGADEADEAPPYGSDADEASTAGGHSSMQCNALWQDVVSHAGDVKSNYRAWKDCKKAATTSGSDPNAACAFSYALLAKSMDDFKDAFNEWTFRCSWLFGSGGNQPGPNT